MATTKRKPTTKKVYVDLEEILENIAASIENLAGNDNDLREATATLARGLEQAEADANNWRITTAVFALLTAVNTIWLLIK